MYLHGSCVEQQMRVIKTHRGVFLLHYDAVYVILLLQYQLSDDSQKKQLMIDKMPLSNRTTSFPRALSLIAVGTGLISCDVNTI